jgi:hypothetical protein
VRSFDTTHRGDLDRRRTGQPPLSLRNKPERQTAPYGIIACRGILRKEKPFLEASGIERSLPQNFYADREQIPLAISRLQRKIAFLREAKATFL